MGEGGSRAALYMCWIFTRVGNFVGGMARRAKAPSENMCKGVCLTTGHYPISIFGVDKNDGQGKGYPKSNHNF